ncbi:hypothetical protein Taro_046936, partial [Colocasia esculenta]|nr:hypothetical protein [Colocasia esculenta]
MIVAATCRSNRRDRGLNGRDLWFRNSWWLPHSSVDPVRTVTGRARAPSSRSASSEFEAEPRGTGGEPVGRLIFDVERRTLPSDVIGCLQGWTIFECGRPS